MTTMNMREVCALFSRSRRTIMRYLGEKRLPGPTDWQPLSWDTREIRAAHKRMREEAEHERKQRKPNGRRRRKKRSPKLDGE